MNKPAIYVNPVVYEPLFVDSYSGDEISLSSLIDSVKELNIPESEYSNVFCNVNPDYNPVAYYKRKKTQQEIEKETEEKQRIYDLKKKQKEELKSEKQRIKDERKKLLDSLTPEQRKILRLK